MSSPQQPWSQPGQPTPTQPAPQAAPQAYGAPPGYQAPQGYGAPQGSSGQPSGSAVPTGELVLNIRKPVGAMGMISPVVTIDGYPASCAWGRNAFPAPAGLRQVSIAQNYLWTYGAAVLPVMVEPGQSAEVFYTGPMWTFGMGGNIGTTPQKRPGMTAFVVIMSVVGFVLLLAIIVGIASS